MISNLCRFIAAVPALTVALIHVGTCPACWPLIGGLVSSLGLTFLVETRYLLPLMIGCLAIANIALGRGASRDYRPLAVGIAASVVILTGKFILASNLVTAGGTVLLIGAYSWSFLLRRKKPSSCQSCASHSSPAGATSKDIPIACSLDRTQFAERKELVNRFAQEATERLKLPRGVRLSFEPIPNRVTQLAQLVDLERICCSFLTFKIDAPAGETVWLEVTGPAEAQEVIRELIPEIALTNGPTK